MRKFETGGGNYGVHGVVLADRSGINVCGADLAVACLQCGGV